MAKFSFQLQKILDLRNSEKQQAEAELAKALAVENQIKENLKQIAYQYTTLKSQMKGSVNIEDIISQGQYNNLLEYQKEELLKQQAEAHLVTEEKRGVLLELIKKTTSLEKLKEKQFQEFKIEQRRLENIKADDLNSKRFQNNTN
ncbi:MAG: flagellar export protein FliJ [Treponema sp.]|nr:flagellar export protein FliJ [Spirochaetia bacterium]MDY2841025.1 flagellar export protein FliJ [Treponema sp.]MDY5123417.1 flagellar export protein FliJ [Treponema sp.]